MATRQEKARCVFGFIKTKSDVQTQQNYTTKCIKGSPLHSSIRGWHEKNMETGTRTAIIDEAILKQTWQKSERLFDVHYASYGSI